MCRLVIWHLQQLRQLVLHDGRLHHCEWRDALSHPVHPTLETQSPQPGGWAWSGGGQSGGAGGFEHRPSIVTCLAEVTLDYWLKSTAPRYWLEIIFSRVYCHNIMLHSAHLGSLYIVSTVCEKICTTASSLGTVKPLQVDSASVYKVLWRCWLGGRKGIRPAKTEWWGAGVVICLERGVDLHTAQLMPLPLTVSCFSKIQIGFTFLVPAHLGSLGQRAGKWVCVYNLLKSISFVWSRYDRMLSTKHGFVNTLPKLILVIDSQCYPLKWVWVYWYVESHFSIMTFQVDLTTCWGVCVA